MLVPDMKCQSLSLDDPCLLLTAVFAATDRGATDGMMLPGGTTSGLMRPGVTRPWQSTVDLVGPLLLDIAVSSILESAGTSGQ